MDIASEDMSECRTRRTFNEHGDLKVELRRWLPRHYLCMAGTERVFHEDRDGRDGELVSGSVGIENPRIAIRIGKGLCPRLTKAYQSLHYNQFVYLDALEKEHPPASCLLGKRGIEPASVTAVASETGTYDVCHSRLSSYFWAVSRRRSEVKSREVERCCAR